MFLFKVVVLNYLKRIKVVQGFLYKKIPVSMAHPCSKLSDAKID
jgi:hypothetical protein